MNQREFADYVRTESDRGGSKDQLVAHLTAAGWNQADIEKALQDAQKAEKASPAGTSGANLPKKMLQREVIPAYQPKSMAVRVIFVIGTCLIIVFAAFTILFNIGVITAPTPAFPTLPAESAEQLETPSLSPTYAPRRAGVAPPAQAINAGSPSSANSNAFASLGLSDTDEDQIVTAILTQDNVFSSNNAKDIRNYLHVTAVGADAAKISTMSDSDILSYAASIVAGSASANSTILESGTWSKEGSTVYVSIPVGNGVVTRTSTEVGGVWY